jgi:hypothetical protein
MVITISSTFSVRDVMSLEERLIRLAEVPDAADVDFSIG